MDEALSSTGGPDRGRLRQCSLCPLAMYALPVGDAGVVFFCEHCDGPLLSIRSAAG